MVFVISECTNGKTEVWPGLIRMKYYKWVKEERLMDGVKRLGRGLGPKE